MSWQDDIEGSEYIPSVVYPEMDSVLERVKAVGGKALSYVGTGMTAVILREGDVAFKISRDLSPTNYSWLEAEYEWFESAHPVDPSHVVRPLAWYADELVLVHDYVEGRPFGWAPREIGQHFNELGKKMQALDWGMPEFKDNSYVKTETGFVLVDGTMANRLCGRLVTWLTEWLDGQRHPWTTGSLGASTLAFLVRREVQEGCVDPLVGGALEARIGQC